MPLISWFTFSYKFPVKTLSDINKYNKDFSITKGLFDKLFGIYKLIRIASCYIMYINEINNNQFCIAKSNFTSVTL